MLYNEDRKKQFIQQKGYSSNTIKLYRAFFNKLGAFECLYEKDVVEFDIEQLASVLYGLKCKTRQSVISKLSLLRCYIYWEVENGYLPSKNILIDLPRFKGKGLDTFINKTGSEAQYILDRESLYELVAQLYNPRDKAIFCLLYEGICGYDYSELRYIKKQHINFLNGTIEIYDEKGINLKRVIKCDDQTVRILNDVVESGEYYTCNGKSETKNNFVKVPESDYLIRVNRGQYPLSCKSINRLFAQMRTSSWDIDFYCQYLTPTTIRDSGFFNYVKKAEESRKRELLNSEFSEALEYYGLSKGTILSYRTKYKDFKKIVKDV